MGCGCKSQSRGIDKNDESYGGKKKPSKKLSNFQKKQALQKLSQDQREKTTIRIRPKEGLYDTRDWDSQYALYAQDKGGKPGKHPDPDCIWNSDPDSFNFREYAAEIKQRKDQAKADGRISII